MWTVSKSVVEAQPPSAVFHAAYTGTVISSCQLLRVGRRGFSWSSVRYTASRNGHLTLPQNDDGPPGPDSPHVFGLYKRLVNDLG